MENAFEEGEIVEGQLPVENEPKLADESHSFLPSWLKGKPPKRKRSYSSSSPSPPLRDAVHVCDVERHSQLSSPTWLSGSFKNWNLSNVARERKKTAGGERNNYSSNDFSFTTKVGEAPSPPPPPPPPSDEQLLSFPPPPPPVQSPPHNVANTIMTLESSTSGFTVRTPSYGEESSTVEQPRPSSYDEQNEKVTEEYGEVRFQSFSKDKNLFETAELGSRNNERSECISEEVELTTERSKIEDSSTDEADFFSNYVELIRDTIQNNSNRVPKLRSFLDCIGAEKHFVFLKDIHERRNQRMASIEREFKSVLELELAQEQVEKKYFESFIQSIRLDRLEKNVTFVELEWNGVL
ncbi:hypothetical protein GpartN1_g3125.t1 [Galdieria partita]|uniref:Uncharacterized protein n=1 Tax=Galdieria partita TaxID=83374 RepID=A0A9C7UPV9_9RHOD|nr:hypothetical protein GpartN1_g3125.t1 [Galdieria partita]